MNYVKNKLTQYTCNNCNIRTENFYKRIIVIENPKPTELNNRYGNPTYQNNHAQCTEITKCNFEITATVKPQKYCESTT